MDAERHQAILQQVRAGIQSNRMVFPSLPEIALKVREIINDPSCNSAKLASAISMDAGFSARLLKLANSSSLRASKTITDLKTAISRLGMQHVKTLVICLCAVQVMAMPKGRFADFGKSIIKCNTRVSALCYALASTFTSLDPDEAMLAGIVHDIGIFPLMEFLNESNIGDENQDSVLKLIHGLHPEIGGMVLSSWNLPQAIIEVAEQHENIARFETNEIDFTDLVIIANLEERAEFDLLSPDASIPAVSKLKLTTDTPISEIPEIAEKVRLVSDSLVI